MNENVFYGKYRGVVSDNRDLMNLGRIKAKVPDVFGDRDSGWAYPCVPYAGKQMGFFAVPPIGASVWIEFECGDPDYPIWSGCWWQTPAEMPSLVMTPPPPGTEPRVLIRTNGGHSIVLDDTPGQGGITFECSTGQKIKMTATGIEIDDGQGGKITLQGPKVSVNDGALEVT